MVVFTLEQAKSWTKRRFDDILDRLFWEYVEIPSEADWDWEPKVTPIEKVNILEEARRRTKWLVERKFGKSFGSTRYKSLNSYVEGLH